MMTDVVSRDGLLNTRFRYNEEVAPKGFKDKRAKGDFQRVADSEASLPVSKASSARGSRAASSERGNDMDTLPLTLHADPDSAGSSAAGQHHPVSHSHHPHHHHTITHLPHHHHQHQQPHGSSLHGGDKCGVIKTLGNIFVSFVGAGVLALPNAFAKSGVVLGTVFMVGVSILAFYCIILLVDCKRALEAKGVATYSEVAEACLGVWGKRLVEVLLVLSQTGFCVAYLVFIGSNLEPLTHLHKAVIICSVIPFQVALAMLRDLTMLAPFSLLADAALIAGMVVVLGDDVMEFKSRISVVMSKGLGAVPFLFGVVIYCYEGIGMILPLEDSMRDKSKFKGTLAGGFSLITAVFVVFGLVGYAAFGEDTEAPVTLNLDPGWSTAAVKVSLCIGLFFTFPVMMVPVYEIADRALDAWPWFEKHVSPLKQSVLRRLGRTFTIVTLGFIASTVCNFGVFISFIGSFACALLAFIIPSLCHIILYKGKASNFVIAGDVFLAVFGIVGMIFGVREYFLSLPGEEGC